MKELINIIVVFPKKEVALKIKNILVKNGYDVAAVCLTGARAMEAVERLEAAHLPEVVAEILRVVTQPEGEHHPTETKPMQKHRLTEIQLV